MASPFMDGYIQILDNNGDPASGAKLNFYQSGTTTRKDTFSDEALTSANANPVVCDSNGRPGPIYLETGNGGYSVVITDSADNTLETIDPVGQQVDNDDLTAATGFYRKLFNDTNGPFLQLGNMRIWYDATNDRVRYKVGSDPGSETDGTSIGATFDDAFSESGLLDLGGFKIWRQADGQWRSKNGTPSSADDGALLSNLFSGDFGDGDDNLIRMDRSGTIYRLWVDTDGDPRIIAGTPASDTDGKKIGSQATIQTGDLLDTTSGTSVNTSDLGVSTPQRITLAFDQVSLDGTDNLLVQIGPSGGVETSGYTSDGASIASGTDTVVNSTSGFIISIGVAAREFTGIATLVNVTGNVWNFAYSGRTSSGIAATGGGRKELAGSLTQVTVTPTGADNFDGGQIRVLGEE